MATDAETIARLRAIVDEQAEDEGLWFVAATAPEAYLQQELRRLHDAIEFDGSECDHDWYVSNGEKHCYNCTATDQFHLRRGLDPPPRKGG